MPDHTSNGMHCNEFDLLLSDALDGVLSGPGLDRFQAHARTCKACGPLLAEAEAYSSRVVAGLFPIAERGEKILFCEPSCLSAVKEDAPDLLRGEEQRKARVVADTCQLFEEFASGLELPQVDRVHRTIDSYLRYAEHHQAAYRTIVSGGVGFDTEVHAVRDGVREAIVATIAEGAYGRTDIAPLARAGLLAWLCSVEGATLDWIDRPELSRETMCELLVKTLGGTLRAIEELDPSYRAPAPARR